MTIIWSETAREDINSYKLNSKIINVEKYIEELIEYTNYLQDNPRMGKFIFNIDKLEIRQLIFRMHRIFYIINEKNIIIIEISHTARNLNDIIKYLNKCLKK